MRWIKVTGYNADGETPLRVNAQHVAAYRSYRRGTMARYSDGMTERWAETPEEIEEMIRMADQ